MTHLPFIAASYGLTLAVAVWLTADAVLRTRRARVRLAALRDRA